MFIMKYEKLKQSIDSMSILDRLWQLHTLFKLLLNEKDGEWLKKRVVIWL